MPKKLQEKIRADAKGQADQVLKVAKAEAAERLKKVDAQLSQKQEREIAKGKEGALLEKQRRIAEANLSVKRSMSEMKEELMVSVLQKGRSQLQSLTPQKYAKLVSRLVADSLRDIDGDTEVAVSKGSMKAIKLPKGTKVKEEKMDAGAIVRTKDGSLQIDHTLPVRLDRMEDQLRGEIAKALFK